MEDEFFALYGVCERDLQTLLGTANSVNIQSGEGMLALGRAKSVIRPGDRVLAASPRDCLVMALATWRGK